MNFTHNVKNAFQSFLQVRNFFAGQANDMTVNDIGNAGFSLGQIFYYLVVDSTYADGVPPDPFDTLMVNN